MGAAGESGIRHLHHAYSRLFPTSLRWSFVRKETLTRTAWKCGDSSGFPFQSLARTGVLDENNYVGRKSGAIRLDVVPHCASEWHTLLNEQNPLDIPGLEAI